MTETIYQSARRRLPELEAEAETLATRLKAIRAEIADARPLAAKATPGDVELSGNSGQLPRPEKPARRKGPIIDLSEQSPGQSEIIAARVNGDQKS